MPSGLDYFSTTRIRRLMAKFQDRREVPGDLLFLGRTAKTPATDDEITARFTIRGQIADIITDDSPAVVYRNAKVDFITTSGVKLKFGIGFNEDMIRKLMTVGAQGIPDSSSGAEFAGNVQMRAVDKLYRGCMERREALIIAMKLDGWHNDRLGVKIDSSWGMYSDLKITPAVPWTDTANGTPVNDAWAVKLLGKRRYGINFNRMTMTTPAFQAMIATTEFQTKARVALAPNVSYAAIPPTNLTYQMGIAQNIMGMTIDLYDGRYWSEDETGLRTSANFLPNNRVIVEDSGNDNDPDDTDLALMPVTESMLADALPNGGDLAGTIGRGVRGPYAYRYIDPSLDPPRMVLWGVDRCIPRKFMQQSNAVMNIGNIADAIPITEPS